MKFNYVIFSDISRTISVPYWTIALVTAASVNEAINILSFARIPADFRVRKIAF